MSKSIVPRALTRQEIRQGFVILGEERRYDDMQTDDEVQDTNLLEERIAIHAHIIALIQWSKQIGWERNIDPKTVTPQKLQTYLRVFEEQKRRYTWLRNTSLLTSTKDVESA